MKLAEFAAGLVAVVVLVATVTLVVVSFIGVDTASVQRACRTHHGVASVSSSWAWKTKTLVVCRDGSVQNGRP